MRARRLRTAVLLLAAVPVTAAAAALKASHWRLTCSRHGIWLEPRPRPRCPDCHGAGGWWTNGPYPDMEACWCWAERRELVLRLLPVRDPWPDEPPFCRIPVPPRPADQRWPGRHGGPDSPVARNPRRSCT